MKWRFPKLRVTLFGGPCSKDCSILGSILGSPYFGQLPDLLLRIRSRSLCSQTLQHGHGLRLSMFNFHCLQCTARRPSPKTYGRLGGDPRMGNVVNWGLCRSPTNMTQSAIQQQPCQAFMRLAATETNIQHQDEAEARTPYPSAL